MKLIFLGISVLLLSAFAFATIYENNDDPDLIIDKVLKKTSDYAVKKYHFDVIGDNVSFPNGNLKGMGLAFQTDNQFSRDKAKEILLDVGKFMLCRINENSTLLNQMEQPPFSIKNITVKFFLPINKVILRYIQTL